jgi:hypothetical protein
MEKVLRNLIGEEWVLELKLKKVQKPSKAKHAAVSNERNHNHIEHLGRDGEWW